MSARTDILLDDDLDLRIENGDFVIGPSDEQHIELLLRSAPGHWKKNPLIGANLAQDINGFFDGEARKRIRLTLQADGYTTERLKFTDNTIQLDVE